MLEAIDEEYLANLHLELGTLYLEKGLKKEAEQRLQLAKSLYYGINSVNRIEECQSLIQIVKGQSEKNSNDLLYFEEDQMIFVEEKGWISLKKLPILNDLTKCLFQTESSGLTKNDFSLALWDENYSPLMHDNRIYVTIRRLRKIIEPDPKNPKYIITTRNGYRLRRRQSTRYSDSLV